MRKLHVKLISVAAIAGLALVASCGSSGESGSSTPPSTPPSTPSTSSSSPAEAPGGSDSPATPESPTSDASGASTESQTPGADGVKQAVLSPSDYATIPEKVVEDAKAEGGKLLWYESSQEQQIAPLIEQFKKVYPFADVQHARLLGTDVSSRVAQETAAGAATADVTTTGASTTFGMQENLRTVDWAAAGIPDELVTSDYSVLQVAQPYGIVYNTERVKGDDIPKTWKDLLDPKWSGGKICLWLHATPLANLVTAWGGDEATSFVEKLVAQKPMVIADAQCAQKIAAGEAMIGVDNAQNLKRMTTQGAPVDLVWPDDLASVDLLVSAIPKNSAHPAMAELFLAWLATKDGALALEKQTFRGNPLLPDTESHKMLSGVNLAAWPVDESKEYLTWVDKFTNLLQG